MILFIGFHWNIFSKNQALHLPWTKIRMIFHCNKSHDQSNWKWVYSVSHPYHSFRIYRHILKETSPPIHLIWQKSHKTKYPHIFHCITLNLFLWLYLCSKIFHVLFNFFIPNDYHAQSLLLTLIFYWDIWYYYLSFWLISSVIIDNDWDAESHAGMNFQNDNQFCLEIESSYSLISTSQRSVHYHNAYFQW